MQNSQDIIADGPERRLLYRQHIEEEVMARHVDELATAKFQDRVRLWFRIQWEISEEMQRRGPSPYALYHRRAF